MRTRSTPSKATPKLSTISTVVICSSSTAALDFPNGHKYEGRAHSNGIGPTDIKGHFLMRQVAISTAFAAGLVFSSGAREQTSGLAIAAQQPAAVISTAPAPPGDTIRQALARKEITYANVWADDKGQTHVTKCVLKGLQLHAFAPPAAPYMMGIVPEDIESIVFSMLPAGWFGDWHHAPGPQWVITLSGQWEVQTMDRSTLRQDPGEFQFNSTNRPSLRHRAAMSGIPPGWWGPFPTSA